MDHTTEYRDFCNAPSHEPGVLISPRRSRVFAPFAALAVLILGAGIASLASAQEDSACTFITSGLQPQDKVAEFNSQQQGYAQNFTTGPYADGYAPEGVTVWIKDSREWRFIDVEMATFDVYSTNHRPKDGIGVLTHPALQSNNPLHAFSGRVALRPDTAYALRLQCSGGCASDNHLRYGVTTSVSVHAGGQADAASYTVTGLQAGLKCDFKVWDVNGDGPGARSDRSTVIAGAQPGSCSRTRTAPTTILDLVSPTNCADVTSSGLSRVADPLLLISVVTELNAGDVDGHSLLTDLNLSPNAAFTELPAATPARAASAAAYLPRARQREMSDFHPAAGVPCRWEASHD